MPDSWIETRQMDTVQRISPIIGSTIALLTFVLQRAKQAVAGQRCESDTKMKTSGIIEVVYAASLLDC